MSPDLPVGSPESMGSGRPKIISKCAGHSAGISSKPDVDYSRNRLVVTPPELPPGLFVPSSTLVPAIFSQNIFQACVNSAQEIGVVSPGMEQVLTEPESIPCQHRASELDDIEGLVVRYRAQVMRLIAFSMDDADEAASIAQDCFLKAYRTRDQFRGQCAVSTWLLQIAYNLMRDRLRTRKFQFWRRARQHAVDVSELTERMASLASGSESQLIARERVAQVWAVLSELSPRQRSVFVLRFVEGMELTEIVQATGMNSATVKTHLYRALHQVRSRVGGERKGSPA